MHMSSYLLPFLDTGIDDICIYLSILTDILYLDGEKLSMKTFFLVVYPNGFITCVGYNKSNSIIVRNKIKLNYK